MLGEGEILGQVRKAWERAQDEHSCGPQLNLLFRHALEAGKRVRTDTDIARHIRSVSEAAVDMAADRLPGGLGGASSSCWAPARWARAWPRSLVAGGVTEVLVANRTLAAPRRWPPTSAAGPSRLSDVAGALTTVDVLLTSTGATSMLRRARRPRSG